MASAHEHTQSFHQSGAGRCLPSQCGTSVGFRRDLGAGKENGTSRKLYVVLIILLLLYDEMKQKRKHYSGIWVGVEMLALCILTHRFHKFLVNEGILNFDAHISYVKNLIWLLGCVVFLRHNTCTLIQKTKVGFDRLTKDSQANTDISSRLWMPHIFLPSNDEI